MQLLVELQAWAELTKGNSIMSRASAILPRYLRYESSKT